MQRRQGGACRPAGSHDMLRTGRRPDRNNHTQAIHMTARSFPSYRLFKDNRNRWRWRYDVSEDETIAVSSDSYDSRHDCEQAVTVLRASIHAPLWISKMDLAGS